MSMFDTIILNGYKLKQPTELTKLLKEHGQTFPEEFQTKDLANCLVNYKIDSNGQIFESHFVPTGKKKKREFPFFKNSIRVSFLERLYFKFSRGFGKYSKSLNRPLVVDELKEIYKKSNITSTFNIYTYGSVGNNKRIVDLEYNIVAINGKIKSTKLINCKIESEKDAIERLKDQEERDRQFQEQTDRRKKFTSTWYYPILRETINPVCFFSRKIVQFVCNKLINISYKWNGV